MKVENILPEVFTIVSKERAYYLVQEGKKVLTPDISVKSEKWDGGYSYISISFRDLSTGRLLAVTKSSGQGMSIEEDQNIALNKIYKELISNKVFLIGIRILVVLSIQTEKVPSKNWL